MILDEGMKCCIVTLLDEVGLRGSEGIGAGKSAIKPRFKTLLEGEESELVTPFNPV